jgi:hypothetical protein
MHTECWWENQLQSDELEEGAVNMVTDRQTRLSRVNFILCVLRREHNKCPFCNYVHGILKFKFNRT